MNRIKALFIADRIMTRIETDKAIHKDAIADEIQAAEVIDVISYDEAKGKWVFRDGTPIEPEAEQVEPLKPLPPLASPTPAEILELITHGLSVHRIRLEDFKL